MRFQATVYGQLLQELSRREVDRIAARHIGGRAKRVLSCWAHLVAMVLTQLAAARSLRDFERLLERHPGTFAHLGLKAVRRSTLADANAGRSAAFFEDVAYALIAKLGRGKLPRETVRLIDATRIYAGKAVASWAKGGVKLHLCLDPQRTCPVWFAITSERVNDITPARTSLPIEPGATYVFDKAFCSFAFWADLDQAGCRFVTRLKKNAPFTLIEERPARGDGILGDRVVRLSQRLAGSRGNPFDVPARVIEVRPDNGRVLILVSNDLEAPAEEIAALYKARWQIELFFKWIKQNLKLSHFLGTSENAVRIQILSALIAFLLIKLASQAPHATLTPQAIARLLPAIILTRRSIAPLLKPPDPPPQTAPIPQLPFRYVHVHA